MSSVVVTGSGGFIGRELVSVLIEQGHEVFALSRQPAAGSGQLRWHLGENLPSVCAAADAIVHLASATLVDTDDMQEAYEKDVEGTRLIIDGTRRARAAGRRQRIIYLSSQSARPGASNIYGRSKWAIEALLDEPDDIIVRPGLVYGDPSASVFAMFEKLSRMPIVPDVGEHRGIQPIHVRELAECLAQLVTMGNAPKLLKLGAVSPLSFGEALCTTARRRGRRAPLLLPVPAAPVRLITQVIDRALGTRLTERLAGLTGLAPMDTAESLARLGRTLAPFAPEYNRGQ